MRKKFVKFPVSFLTDIYLRLKGGFALIEILIAITILSILLLGIFSGLSAGIFAISGNKNLTIAMIIARSKLNEFILEKMRGSDVQKEPVDEYPNFYYSKEVKRFEHEIFGPLDANRVEITVLWKDRGRDKKYNLFYIYPVR